MKFAGAIFLLFIAFNPGYAAQQPVPDPIAATRDAIVKGDAQQALSAMEAKALEAEKQAVTSTTPQRSWAQASVAYREASGLARSSGQLQKAVSYGHKALEAAERSGQPAAQTRAIGRLALAYMQLGQDAKAKELWEKGIEIAKNIDVRQIQGAQMHRGLGQIQLRQGEIQKSTENLSRALDLVEVGLIENRQRPMSPDPKAMREIEHNVEEVRVGILVDLGNSYRRAGKTKEAIESFEKGILVIKESGVKSAVEANLDMTLGLLYLNQKEFARSLTHLNRSLEMAEQFRAAPFIYQASSALGELHLQTEKPQEAIAHFKRAIESIESTRALLQSEEFRSSYFEDKRATYTGLILAYLRTKNFAEAFNYSERARSRAFLDILGSKVELSRSGTLLEHERALQARISVLQAMMAGQDRGSAETPQLRKELTEAQQDYSAFLAKVRQENSEQAALMNVEPLNLKQVQDLLDPGVTMLEFFVTRGAVWLWVIERDRLRFVNLPISRVDLVANVTGLRDTIFQFTEKDRFNALSQELYKLLIEPALPHVRGKELLIVPHDVLHYLPYQSLVSSQGKYLIQDYPIYYLSSASLMQFTREKRRASRESALALGNPNLGDESYNLRFAEREAREISQLYPKSTVFVKDQATKSKALTLSGNHDIVHFAVHAQFDEDDPMGSALLLAKDANDDGRLKVSEIFSMNLKADMVVLSACETGLGKVSNGDEIVGMTRAFIYAGTPSVVTTLWKVNDRSSYELMREFYANLKSMKKSEALRQAQLTAMKEFPEPFFWAAYQLTGES